MDLTKEQRSVARKYLMEMLDESSDFCITWMKNFGDGYQSLDSEQKEEACRLYKIITESEC